MNILDTQLIIHSDCKLTSVGQQNLNSINPDILDKYVSVEFLKYKDKYLTLYYIHSSHNSLIKTYLHT
jgi:hypothetical protein